MREVQIKARQLHPLYNEHVEQLIMFRRSAWKRQVLFSKIYLKLSEQTSPALQHDPRKKDLSDLGDHYKKSHEEMDHSME